MVSQSQLFVAVALAILLAIVSCDRIDGASVLDPDPTLSGAPAVPVTTLAAPVPTPTAVETIAVAAERPVAAEFPVAPPQLPGAARPTAAVRQAPLDRLPVTARLLGREGKMPHCGVIYVVEIMLYEVVGATADFANGQQIIVAQGCPEFLQAELGLHTGAPSFFVVGELYELELARKYPATAPDRGKPWPTVGGRAIPDDAPMFWAETTQRQSATK